MKRPEDGNDSNGSRLPAIVPSHPTPAPLINGSNTQLAGHTLNPDMSRRGFGKLVTGGLALTAAGGGIVAARDYLYEPDYEIGLLKMDENHELALAHYSFSNDDDSGDKNAARTSLGQLSPRTTEPDGRESIIVSPDLLLAPKLSGVADDDTNIDGQHITIKNNPKNLYIPYHLLDHVASFEIRREGEMIELKMLTREKALSTMETASRKATYAAQMVTYTKDRIAYEAQLAAHKGAEALDDVGDGIASTARKAAHAVEGLWGGNAIDPNPVPEAETPQPTFQKPVEPTLDLHNTKGAFTLRFKAPNSPAELPYIHFYNSTNIDFPSFTLNRIELGKMLTSGKPAKLIESTPKKNTDGTIRVNAAGEPELNISYRPSDFGFEIGAAQKCREACKTSDGAGPHIYHFGRKFLWHDSALSEDQKEAVSMATEYQTGLFKQRGFADRVAAQWTGGDTSPGPGR